MRYFNRYVVICVTALLTLFAEIGYAAHMYYIGVLTSYSNDQMVIEGKNYTLAPKVKVILRVVGSNGAIHEQLGRLSDVSVGNKLTIKVLNGEVTEIEKIVSR